MHFVPEIVSADYLEAYEMVSFQCHAVYLIVGMATRPRSNRVCSFVFDIAVIGCQQ
jgi:hypothetical protein